MLTARRDQYKAAALKMKRAGDEYKAKDYMRTAKVSIILYIINLVS